ncbi:MAG TPA: hypothetical protein VH419_04670, partial [Nocardioidaceae bacterium]
MPAHHDDAHVHALGTEAALTSLVNASLANIPGADMASVTIRSQDQHLSTAAASDDLAYRLDEIQYELREGPCYDAVTISQFALDNDLRHGRYPRYGPRAADLGLGSQLATQVAHNGTQAGLNVYARRVHAF